MSKSMTRPWAEIEEFYARYTGKIPSYAAMYRLVKEICTSRYVAGIHAWTSHYDLCIVQCEAEYPYDGPYLKISPQNGDTIEFRYIDTYVKSEQWVRVVPCDAAFDRLRRFFHQLHWYSDDLLNEGAQHGLNPTVDPRGRGSTSG